MSMQKILSILAIELFLALFCMPLSANPAGDQQNTIDWQDWSAEVFERATRENKLVLLNLEAVWCHWCHVMDQKTYSDKAVVAIIQANFIAVKVDHDARPDLANRYRDYGWPATIVLNSDGEDIMKRAGFVAPDRFANLLLAVVDDPTPAKGSKQNVVGEYAQSAILSDDLERELLARHYSSFDWELGGYRSKKKTMDRDSTEYALVRGARGDQREQHMARLTIDASMALIDPEWGGAYQYSTYGDWDHPHFEKIMAIQAGFLRLYALAYLQWQELRYLQAALDIEKYLAGFLTSPDGAYYTSQDADLVQGVKGAAYFALTDNERRSRGLPRIDTHVYSRENGWAIEAVTNLYQATGNAEYLQKAMIAADWIIAHRSLPGGGFRHSEVDQGGPYLADTLNMGRAFLQLYRATGERQWLGRAAAAGEFIAVRFSQEQAGFLSGVAVPGMVSALPNIDENVSATRFLNLLAHYTGDAELRAAAEHGMRYLATTAVATRRIEEGGILLAAQELANDPAHFTIVGPKNDAVAKELYDIATKEAGWYKRIEWWDVAEGPLLNPDVLYPTFDKAAAFVCTEGRCSVPAFGVEQYVELIARLSRPRTGS